VTPPVGTYSALTGHIAVKVLDAAGLVVGARQLVEDARRSVGGLRRLAAPLNGFGGVGGKTELAGIKL